MKTLLKRSTLVSFAVLLLCLIFAPKANAATNPLKNMPTTCKEIYLVDWSKKGAESFATLQSKSYITMKATSSNKKVATVTTETVKQGKKYIGTYTIKTKGYGTTKIKVKATVGGKTYTKTCKYTFEKYKNPFKTLKIGNKSYVKKADKAKKNSGVIHTGEWILNGKILIEMKKGYKLKGIYTMNYETGKQKKIKNGSKLTDVMSPYIIYQNTKTGAIGIIYLEE